MINDIISASILAVIIVLSFQTILTPYSNYKNFFQAVNDVPVSHISNNEFEAANWLRNHADVRKSPNAFIISDHATSQIFRGMTGLNSSAGRHPDIDIKEWKTLQVGIEESLSPTDYTNLNKVIGSLRNDTQVEEVYIVLSKRTCWWSSQPNIESIRFMPLPGTFSWEDYCSNVDEKLRDKLEADLLFRNDDVVIYEFD